MKISENSTSLIMMCIHHNDPFTIRSDRDQRPYSRFVIACDTNCDPEHTPVIPGPSENMLRPFYMVISANHGFSF